ncbi:metal ABC transporter ATP-binding protein [Spirochaetia bacterium]|nr:metal ABC transporter ATP-binding protein [Spirochaetia bacterium]
MRLQCNKMTVKDTDTADTVGPIITCHNTCFGYDGYTVINGLNFTVNAGDYLCIVGKNGSGKSTLIKGMLCLLNPLQGEITFCNGFKKEDIGYLSQQTAVKRDFPAGVFEIVLSGSVGGMGLRPFYSTKEKRLALENMDRLGIADLKELKFSELSGGQQRRVLIGRALCASRGEPQTEGLMSMTSVPVPYSLLVLDEPAAGLDPLATAELYTLLQKINREIGITIIMVSHDIEAAEKYATKILHVQNKQCFFGDTKEYLNSTIGKQFSGTEKEEGNGF